MTRTRLLISLLALAEILPATTVVVLRTPKHAVLGVDGRSTSVVNGRKRRAVACKAAAIDNVVYVVEGYVSFDIRSILETGGSPADPASAARAHDLIRRALTTALPGIRRNDPARWSQLTSGNTLFALYAAWANQESARVSITQFSLTPDGRSVDSQTKQWDSVDPNAGMVFWDAVKRAPHPFPDDWPQNDHVQTVKAVLTDLVATDPESGPPLTLIRVTPAGIDWLDRGACEPDGSNAFRSEPARP